MAHHSNGTVVDYRYFALTLFAVLAYSQMQFSSTNYNEHVRLAQAFLHGHIYLDEAANWIDHFSLNGHTYTFQPPGVALLLMPSVWLFGSINQTHAAMCFGLIMISAAYLLTNRAVLWLSMFMAFGTIATWAAVEGASWEIALLATVPFSLFAIKASKENHPILTGLCAGLAALMRYDMVLCWPIYAFQQKRNLIWFQVALCPAIAVLMWYNYERFGDITTTGWNYYSQVDHSFPTDGAFNLRYLPQNLTILFLTPPTLDSFRPYLHIHMGGQTIFWTSPAFLSALRARISSETIALWGMALAVSIPSLLYYQTGWIQFGARHYIMAYPFLYGLMVNHANEHGLDQFDKILIIASIAFVTYGIWYIHNYNWTF